MGLIECTPPTASIDYVRWSPAKKERMKDILVKIPAPWIFLGVMWLAVLESILTMLGPLLGS